MKVLLTRPFEDSLISGKKIKKFGIDYEITPLIEIKKIDTYSKKLFLETDFDLLIFTSRNSVKLFDHSKYKNKPTIVIGEGTYNELLKIKSNGIYNGGGNSKNIQKIFLEKFSNNVKNILHPCAENVNVELEYFFKRKEIHYKKLPIYKVIKTNRLYQKFKSFFLSNNQIIILFSPLTAESLVESVKKMKLEKYCLNKKVLVMSERVKTSLKGLAFSEIIVSQKPNESDLISTISKLS